eukprot:14874193-Alexandrium_andersonii.AAC.1
MAGLKLPTGFRSKRSPNSGGVDRANGCQQVSKGVIGRPPRQSSNQTPLGSWQTPNHQRCAA